MTAKPREDQLHVAEQLPAALRLFGSVFYREVDAPLLGEIKGSRSPLSALMGDDPLGNLPLGGSAGALEALAVEYCRLFIGPSGHLPPVESVCLGEGCFFGSSTQSVLAFYNSVGITPLRGTNVPPDHISMELDCLAILEESGRHYEATAFARNHLLRWLPTLVGHVVQHAQAPFYRAWAKTLEITLTEMYAEQDQHDSRPPSL